MVMLMVMWMVMVTVKVMMMMMMMVFVRTHRCEILKNVCSSRCGFGDGACVIDQLRKQSESI